MGPLRWLRNLKCVRVHAHVVEECLQDVFSDSKGGNSVMCVRARKGCMYMHAHMLMNAKAFMNVQMHTGAPSGARTKEAATHAKSLHTGTDLPQACRHTRQVRQVS